MGETETDQGPVDLGPGERARHGRRAPVFRAKRDRVAMKARERPALLHPWQGTKKRGRSPRLKRYCFVAFLKVLAQARPVSTVEPEFLPRHHPAAHPMQP